MSNWEDDDDGYCTTAADFQDARRVCEALGIALHRVSFAAQYRERVFSSLPARIRRGPHAESGCALQSRNQIRRLPGLHAASGRLLDRHRPLCAGCATADPELQLLKAADAAKDQSYFLHGVAASALVEDAVSHRRPAQNAGAESGACGRLAGVRQTGQHRHLFHRRAAVPGVPEPLPAHRTGTDRDRRRSRHRRASRSRRSTRWASAPASAWAGAPEPPPRPGTSRTKTRRAMRSSWSRIKTIRCCCPTAFDVEQMHWIGAGGRAADPLTARSRRAIDRAILTCSVQPRRRVATGA